MDKHSKETRSYNMSMIKSSGTKPEETVRKYLFSKGLRYRKNVKTLPGKPDIVLPKYKTIVFVNGCFWHGHKGTFASEPDDTTHTGYTIEDLQDYYKDFEELVDKLRSGEQ